MHWQQVNSAHRATTPTTCGMTWSMLNLTSASTNDSWTLWIEPQLSLFVSVSLPCCLCQRPLTVFPCSDDRTLHWLKFAFLSCCTHMCHLLFWLLSLLDISIHFFFLISISLITLFFLLPDNFNFHDVVDKYPAHFRWGPWHPGPERPSHMISTLHLSKSHSICILRLFQSSLRFDHWSSTILCSFGTLWRQYLFFPLFRLFFFHFDAAAAKRLVFVCFSLFSVLFATAHTFRTAALSFVHVLLALLLSFHFCCLGFLHCCRLSCCRCRLRCRWSCFLLLPLIPLLCLATAYFSSFLPLLSSFALLLVSLSFSLASYSFSTTLLLLFSLTSFFLFRILKGTSPSTFRSFCLPPPAPFAFSLSLFLSTVSSMSILMHIGTSPATCLNFCLPPPFPFFLSFSSLASVFAVFWPLVAASYVLRLIPLSRLLTVVAMSFLPSESFLVKSIFRIHCWRKSYFHPPYFFL